MAEFSSRMEAYAKLISTNPKMASFTNTFAGAEAEISVCLFIGTNFRYGFQKILTSQGNTPFSGLQGRFTIAWHPVRDKLAIPL